VVGKLWWLNNWKNVMGGKWPSIEALGRSEPGGMVHQALRAFAGDIRSGAA